MITIPIFFASDDLYAPYLATAVYSLIKNSSTGRDGEPVEYHIIILHDQLSEIHKRKLAGLGKEHFSIKFVDIGHKLSMLREKKSNCLRCDYFTMTIYFRLFIADMFPQYDKGIYLDSDIVVPGDILELYETDLQGMLLGGCVDKSIQNVPPLLDYIDKAVGVDHRKYINSGVLLLNMNLLRSVNMAGNFVELLNRWNFDSIAPDQDYINAMCAGSICYLDDTWNTMPSEDALNSKLPKLIHYNLFAKPWKYDGIQYGEDFWKYATESGYLQEICREKISYTNEQKVRDSDKQALMVFRGMQIVENGITFANAALAGARIRLSHITEA